MVANLPLATSGHDLAMISLRSEVLGREQVIFVAGTEVGQVEKMLEDLEQHGAVGVAGLGMLRFVSMFSLFFCATNSNTW